VPLAEDHELVKALVASLVVPVFGEFPVPLLGFGPSPAVGAFLGLAVLERLSGRGAELEPEL
jgi:hypothetical protein